MRCSKNAKNALRTLYVEIIHERTCTTTRSHESQCKHGNVFKTQGHMKLLKRSVIVYHETGETVVPCDVYGRQIQSCRCIQQCDLHRYLLYHLGNGITVDYIVLQN